MQIILPRTNHNPPTSSLSPQSINYPLHSSSSTPSICADSPRSTSFTEPSPPSYKHVNILSSYQSSFFVYFIYFRENKIKSLRCEIRDIKDILHLQVLFIKMRWKDIKDHGLRWTVKGSLFLIYRFAFHQTFWRFLHKSSWFQSFNSPSMIYSSSTSLDSSLPSPQVGS